jgi:putative colanic acid biosynthesis glycosyltransferase
MRFSIVTVTRNNLPGLQATTKSIEAQVFKDFEWIVIDGASVDGTVAFLTSLSPETRLRWISEPDHGIYDAMNKGLHLVCGDYILFLNAGDELESPDTLRNLSRHDCDFIYGDSLEDSHYKRARSHRNAVAGMFTHHQSMIYRRRQTGDLAFDIRYPIAADYKFTLAFLRQAASITYVPAPICRFAPGGVSQTQIRAGRMEQFRIRRELRACLPPVNIAIFLAQTSIMAVRRHFPALYWHLKRAHNSTIEEQKNKGDQK